ncbi:MAG: hypothetical protein Q9161_009137 [Pseudevernia consocians]
MKVGIVGAGISGVVAGAHLNAAGIDITIFERSSEAGGVWLYDERLPPEPTYPSTRPSKADFCHDEEQGFNIAQHQRRQPVVSEDVEHAPSGPCYEGLSNNVSTKLMKLKINSWLAGTADFVNHRVLKGHPRSFRDQNVLLIGAGVSSTDIAREIGTEAKNIYQVSRGGAFDLPTSFLPPGATRIQGEIRAFESAQLQDSQLTDALQPIPGRVVFKDGRQLTDIHRIILCTGYHMSLPFLLRYHSDNTPVQEANSTVLVTDGTQIHNLHKDIFYIPDPSLIFIGIPFFTATFTLFEFQAMAIAAVLTGKAKVPTAQEMRREYQLRMHQKGTGKMFHSLKDREVEYVNELVEWVNRDGARVGAQPMEGHTQAWHAANIDRLKKIRKIMEDKARDLNSVA